MKRLIILSLLTVVVSACSPYIMVSAQKDMAYEVSRDYPVFLHLGNDVTIPEKNTYNMIKDSLTRSQFKVSDRLEEAKLVLSFSVTMTQRVMRTFDSWPYYYGPWPYYYHPFWYSTFPRVYVTDDRVIKLRLFDAGSFREGKRIPIWEGAVYGDDDDIAARLQESIDFLVDKIGTDFHGRLKIRS